MTSTLNKPRQFANTLYLAKALGFAKASHPLSLERT